MSKLFRVTHEGHFKQIGLVSAETQINNQF